MASLPLPLNYQAERFFYYKKDNQASELFEQLSTQENYLKDNHPYSAVDLEMSGLDPVSDKIIQIAWIPIHFADNCMYFDENQLFTDVKVKHVAKEVLDLTHIKQQDLNNANSIKQILKHNDLQLRDLPVIGHHVCSDLEFMLFNLRKHASKQLSNLRYLDSFYLSNAKLPHLQDHHLQTLEEYYRINAPMHNAYADAISSAVIYWYLQNNVQPNEVANVTIGKEPDGKAIKLVK